MTTPESLHDRLVAVGENWAELNAAADLLEGATKTIFSQYTLEHMAEAGSIGKAEHAARADARYRDQLRAEVEARKRANIARVNYDSARTYIDLLRSKEATERAAMQMR